MLSTMVAGVMSLAGLGVAALGFFVRETNVLSYSIMALGMLMSLGPTISLVLSKRKEAQLQAELARKEAQMRAELAEREAQLQAELGPMKNATNLFNWMHHT